MTDKAYFMLLVLFICAILCAAAWVDYAACKSKTLGIGPSSWGLIQGCLVKPRGGENLIPLGNYRVL